MVETRILTEYKMYHIVLNRISTHSDNVAGLIAVSPSYEALLKWYESLLVDPYSDGDYIKFFKKGSKLEWYLPVADTSPKNWTTGRRGILEKWCSAEVYKSYMREPSSILFIPESYDVESLAST